MMRKLSILVLGVALGAGTVTLATQSRLLSTPAAEARIFTVPAVDGAVKL